MGWLSAERVPTETVSESKAWQRQLRVLARSVLASTATVAVVGNQKRLYCVGLQRYSRFLALGAAVSRFLVPYVPLARSARAV